MVLQSKSFPIQFQQSASPTRIQAGGEDHQAEYPEKIKTNVSTIVGGRLKCFVNQWKELTSDKFILQTISGYKIPFTGPVSQANPPVVNFTSNVERDLCAEAIYKLLEKGVIRACEHTPGQFISSFFTVPKPDGTRRFILNLKNLNRYVHTEHFKLEDIKVARQLITQGCWMASVDLQDTYYMIPIHKRHTKYLRFIFERILYEFLVLPFGLSSSPYVFTKLLKPIVAFLRSRGYTSVLYLDDKLMIENTLQKCLNNIEKSTALVTKIGFSINVDKSNLIPTQKCKFLGFILDSNRFTIELTPEKRTPIVEVLKSLLHKSFCKIMDLASLIGKLVAACPAVDYGFLYTKVLEREKTHALENSSNNFEETMLISPEMKKDLEWWINTIPEAFSPLNSESFNLTIFTDASRTGWGASSGLDRV